MTTKPVTVLMSTYNGQKYLVEQIDSIMNQNYDGRISLVIRDDGSTDKTKEIIKNFEIAEQSAIREIELLECENVGPQKSFLQLIQNADGAEYYFFADQDDIWYPDKIKRAVSAMEQFDEPVCWCSNYDIHNDYLNETRKNILTKTPPFRPLKIIFYNQIPGCTMGFDRQLMAVLKMLNLQNVMMHDSMTLALASCIGTVVYDSESGILHRIHSSNVVGEGHKKIVLYQWIKEKAHLVINKEDYDLSEMADTFLKTGLVKEQFADDVTLLRDYKKSWLNTLRLLRHPDSHDLFMDRTTLSIRCKILMHLF